MELAAVNPVGIFGPVPGPRLYSSVTIIKAMLDGKMPAVRRISFGIVDVRDVADLHLLAMERPDAAGERFPAVASETGPHRIATLLRTWLGPAGRRIPRRQLPDMLMRLTALAVPVARPALPHLGNVRNATAAKARSRLGWTARSSEAALLATAESLIALGLAPKAR